MGPIWALPHRCYLPQGGLYGLSFGLGMATGFTGGGGPGLLGGGVEVGRRRGCRRPCDNAGGVEVGRRRGCRRPCDNAGGVEVCRRGRRRPINNAGGAALKACSRSCVNEACGKEALLCCCFLSSCFVLLRRAHIWPKMGPIMGSSALSALGPLALKLALQA
jgi:hypothetical protein